MALPSTPWCVSLYSSSSSLIFLVLNPSLFPSHSAEQLVTVICTELGIAIFFCPELGIAIDWSLHLVSLPYVGNYCCRIDPKSACRVEVTVNAYFTIKDGRREYNRGRTVSWIVDSEEYAIIDLEKDIAPYFTWGSDQVANFWVRSGDNATCKLASDAQLLDLLRASRLVKLFMVVGRRELNVREEEMSAAVNTGKEEMLAAVNTGEEMIAAVNTVKEEMLAAVNTGEEDMPAAVNIGEEVMPTAVDNDLETLDKGFVWAEAPKYGETTAGPPMAIEEENEHFMTAGCDPDGDEPTGTNEEWRYFKNVDHVVIDPVEKHCSGWYEKCTVDMHQRKRVRSVPEIRDFDSEVVPDDEATMLDDFLAPHTSHDKENPIIKEGDTFVDKNAFVHTTRQYAIKNELETMIEHSDTKRYRARCADQNCNWRVFAKKLHGGNTFMVIKLSGLDVHTCSSKQDEGSRGFHSLGI
ncbi:unnamed protein product [Miscanthus lutarioriparius]|uniref:Transposase MuDR plant domain-containing protein n=1 Tax=Miscanthus lutarioriparius TaxID=422564 RepID=A0A811R1N7_9POAL|nr:unnamed protein product [Miscanthus lutarioriparius]